MIYLTGNMSKTARKPFFDMYPQLGMMLSPQGWRNPWCEHYACDNDGFTNSHKPDWWRRTGEASWLRMLDRLAAHHAPLFVALPDVVADWPRTLERSYRYRSEVESRRLRTALVLQNGCDFGEATAFRPDVVFVGGTTLWKWNTIERAIDHFKPLGVWVHVGRVNGERRIRQCRDWGADSCDGTELCRFFDVKLPGVVAGLYDELPAACEPAGCQMALALF